MATTAARWNSTAEEADYQFLRGQSGPPPAEPMRRAVSVIDLFSGCGGMTTGLKEAGRRMGIPVLCRLAVDSDAIAAQVFEKNHAEAVVFNEDVASVISRASARCDILLGGPPCQGHSDLNNRTRRNDSKNDLYQLMATAAVRFGARVVVIENVPAVVHDTRKNVQITAAALREGGYAVSDRIIDTSLLGVPQRRRRHILVASREPAIEPGHVLDLLTQLNLPARTLDWAIRDLEDTDASFDPLHRPASVSFANRRRMAYLFDNGLYDLPDEQRPACHRSGNHSYKSIYGRLQWNAPAQTITTGFTSMGQGRYVHPSTARTITHREAARLQSFPDSFDWTGAPTRVAMSRLIGNAVPPLVMTRIGELMLPDL